MKQLETTTAAPPYQLPAVKVHAGQFAVVRLCDVDVERLTLIDISASICCHLEDGLLGDFPHSFIQLLQIIRDLLNVLLANQEFLVKCKSSPQGYS